ncbi:MAG: hypothetical protein HRU19_23665 [Pseudobacteriovorax sp.]|nr:hypothetical protein [Pseudobacteriovorax sp.]
MEPLNSLPPLTAVNVPSTHFKWIDAQQIDHFLPQHSYTKTLNNLLMQNNLKTLAKRSGLRDGLQKNFLLLEKNDIKMIVSVEILAGKSRRATIDITHSNHDPLPMQSCLLTLIHSVSIWYDIDSMLVPPTINLQADSDSTIIRQKRIGVIKKSGSRYALEKADRLEIAVKSWQLSEQSSPELSSLRYLQIRRIRHKKKSETPPPLRRGILARLFRPKISDSLF